MPSIACADQLTGRQFSHKHNGLYIFLSRTMRPIWNARVINCVKADGKMQWVSEILSGLAGGLSEV